MTKMMTADALAAALKACVGGETIELGDIAGPVRIANTKFATPVTLKGGSVTLAPGAVEWQPAVEFFGSSGFTLDGVKLVGTGAPGQQCGYGVSVVNGSAGIDVMRCDMSNLRVCVMLNNCSDVVIAQNDLHDMREGIDVVASSDVQIVENHFVRFTVGPGDHPDAVQFWTVGGAVRGNARISIIDNLIEGAIDQRPQGVFALDSALGYSDILLERNVIINPLWNAIAFDDGATGLSVIDNRVMNVLGGPPVQGGPIVPWISLPASAVASGNSAPKILLAGAVAKAGIAAPAGNSIIDNVTQAQADAEAAAWVAKFRAPPVVVAPVPPVQPPVEPPPPPVDLAQAKAKLSKARTEVNAMVNYGRRALTAIDAALKVLG